MSTLNAAPLIHYPSDSQPLLSQGTYCGGEGKKNLVTPPNKFIKKELL